MKLTVISAKPAIAGAVVVELISAVVAWRDLDRRTNVQVRGRKAVWRAFITLHPGNSLAYWAFGRRARNDLGQPFSCGTQRRPPSPRRGGVA